MNKGDFVEIDYVGRVKATNEIFDLTREDDAKKENLHNPKQTYKPLLVILGSGMTIKGVEKQLESMNVGEQKEFDVGQDEGFGRRNPNMIKIVSMAKFIENKMNPVPGTFVEIDGMQAKIQSISGGRVRVDFNSPLAGKELHYDLKVVRKIEDPLEKLKAMLDYYHIKYTDCTLTEGKAVIKWEKDVEIFKKLVKKSVDEWIKEIKDVVFETPPAKPKAEGAAEKPAEENKEETANKL
jgi:FKBP-type peptidyl-prolyl cis-trans isomerase 2